MYRFAGSYENATRGLVFPGMVDLEWRYESTSGNKQGTENLSLVGVCLEDVLSGKLQFATGKNGSGLF